MPTARLACGHGEWAGAPIQDYVIHIYDPGTTGGHICLRVPFHFGGLLPPNPWPAVVPALAALQVVLPGNFG